MNKEYTLAQAKQDCIDMWDWLRKNPDKGKNEYFDIYPWEEYPVRSGCAMCEYTKNTLQQEDCCYCPAWGGNGKRCYSDFISFVSWANARDEIFNHYLTDRQILTRRRISATEVLKRVLKIKV